MNRRRYAIPVPSQQIYFSRGRRLCLTEYCYIVYMYTMKRTNIYLTDEQHRRLGKLSEKTLAPVAALIRRAIDEFLKRQGA
jgi:Ribbon-helix-helix domain